MRAIEVRTLMRLLIGTAALIQAVDMAILFHVVFDEGKLRLPLCMTGCRFSQVR